MREEFISDATRNLQRAEVFEFVELKNKDITEGIEEKDLDTVVLDMATPWLAIQHVYNALKGSGILVSFSPTIDQVVKTTEALEENCFIGIETMECLLRRLQTERGRTRPETMMTGHTGYIVIARKALRQDTGYSWDWVSHKCHLWWPL